MFVSCAGAGLRPAQLYFRVAPMSNQPTPPTCVDQDLSDNRAEWVKPKMIRLQLSEAEAGVAGSSDHEGFS